MVYRGGFAGLSKTDRDILGNLDLSRTDHEGITERACLIPASVEAFHGACGCHWGHGLQSHSPSSGMGGITVAHPESWVQTKEAQPPPSPKAFSQHLFCSAEGVAKGRDRASSPQGQGPPCCSVHRPSSCPPQALSPAEPSV